MARPIKDGLSYFPFDVDFFTDPKVRAVTANYGADGLALYTYCLCAIYKNGYYVKADDDFIDCASLDLKLSVSKTRQMLTFFCNRSLFDNKLFTADTVLTAKSVQRRFQEARKNAKRDIFVDPKLWLLENFETQGFIKVRQNSKTANFSKKNGSFSGKNEGYSEKNSTKERKEKEKKEKESKEKTAALPQVSSSSSSILQLNPITREFLVSNYGEKIVSSYENKYNSWCRTHGRNNTNIYATIFKWISEDNVPYCNQAKPSSIDIDKLKLQLMQQYKNE